ncbi:MAG: chromate transporter [Eubacteriales bacterium]
MKKLIELYIEFAKIGLFTIGGGIAMIPLIIDELARKRNWIDEDEIIDAIALCQSLPGVIAVNIATYAGYKLKKLPGALFATLGVITPSFIIIIALSYVAYTFRNNLHMMLVMQALRATAAALIIIAAISIARKTIKDKFTIIVAILSFSLVVFLKLQVYFVILLAVFLGVIFRYRGKSA